MSIKRNKRQDQSLNPSLVRHLVPWQGISIFLAGVLLASWATYFWVTGPTRRNRSSMHEQSDRGVPREPWGHLEYQTITLERPEESFPPPAVMAEPIRWFFEDYTPERLARFFAENGHLTASQRKSMLDPSRWKQSPGGVLVMPPVEVVRDMPLPARKAIYAELQKSSRNFYEQNPVRIPVSKLAEWLARSGMSAEHQRIFRQVCFPEGDSVNFLDCQLLEQIGTFEEKKSLGKALSQVPALLMSLRITPETDIGILTRYWGQGGRERVIRPFLESLSRVPEGISVSITHLLPAFAQLRLYTYPQEQTDELAKREDCFWTAMNFFNATPDNRFFDSNVTKATLESEYSRVETQWTFGDLIMLVEDRQMAIHMCVYLADDVVFTKNGAQGLQPWVLLKIPDMLAQYRSDKRIQMVGYRRKHT
jgi:hypothetical protein